MSARVKINWRGRYEGGGFVVTARRWWSPSDRRIARLAARIMDVTGPAVAEEMQAELSHRMIYGSPRPRA